MTEVLCPYCNDPAHAVDGRQVYPHRPDLHHRRFYVCWVCRAWAPRAISGAPMARLANARTRRLRQQAHQAFDPVWQKGRMSRSQAYAWLRNALGLTSGQCHMAWMSDSNLEAVIAQCGWMHR